MRRGAWAWFHDVWTCVFGKLLTRKGAWAWFHDVWTYVFGKLLMRRGAWAWFHDVWTYVFGKLLMRRGAWAWFHDVWTCVFGKLLTRRGTWAWFHDVWTCGAKVLEYWMISSLKIKVNRSWKFRRSLNVGLMLLKRSWLAEFTGIYLVRFGFQNVRDIDFQLISATQNSNKFQNLGRENQLRTW